MIKLYYNSISPSCRSIQMLLQILNLSTEFHEVDILNKKSQALLSKLNPLETVPIIQDGSFVLWDSHAIASYLAASYAPNNVLYPKELTKRAVVDQRLHFDSSVLYPTLYGAIVPVLFRNKCGISHSNLNGIKKCYEWLNSFLANTKYLCGNEVTIADLACIATASTMDLLHPIDAKKYSKVSAYIRYFEEQNYYHCNLAGLNMLTQEIQERIIRSTSSALGFSNQ